MVSHKIEYEIFEGQIIPGVNHLMPIIKVSTDSMGYGTVKFSIPETSNALGITAQIWAVNAPHVDDYRWIRTGDDLYDNTILDFSGRLLNSTEYEITFKFLPLNITGVSDDDYYSVEFFVTLSQNITCVFSPKIIMNIQDRLVTT